MRLAGSCLVGAAAPPTLRYSQLMPGRTVKDIAFGVLKCRALTLYVGVDLFHLIPGLHLWKSVTKD
jgi:hypothetical protein